MKVGVAYVNYNVYVSRRLKEELAWAIDKRLQVISNKILFKQLYVPTRVHNIYYELLVPLRN